MKKLFILLLFVFKVAVSAQSIAINTNGSAANAAAILELTSTTKGFLPPLMTESQRNAIVLPLAGLQVWCTNCGTSGEMQIYNGTTWTNLLGGAATSLTCGAFVSATVFKVFMCHNLGADTSADPNVPVQAIHGNYYQWGRSAVVANASATSGGISGWNITDASNGAWADGNKTANDPCPLGFRVPTFLQWNYIATSPTVNFISRTGTWTASATNFGSAIHFGATAGAKSLTLPAPGFRHDTTGALFSRGSYGFYWSSTESGSYGTKLSFYETGVIADDGSYRTYGFSVRCVSE